MDLQKRIALGAIVLSTMGVPAFGINADWDGGTGDWETPGNWAGGVVPTNNTFDVLIDNGDGTNSVVSLTLSRTINSLTVDVGDELAILNNRTLTVGDIANDGTILLNGLGNITQINLAGSATFSGSGEIVMQGNAATRISGVAFDDVLTVGSGLTIRGLGAIGNNTINVTNDGTIIAEDAVTPFTLDPRTFFVNTGVIQAQGAGGIALNSGLHDNQGTFEVLAGSKLVANGGAVLKGTFTNTAGGDFTIFANTTLDGFTLDGAATVNNNSTVNVDNGLTVNGTLTLGGLGNITQLSIVGDETFNGNGDIVMEGTNSGTRITGQNFNDVLTTGSGLTIRGLGNVGFNVIDIINQGTIRATDNSAALTIDPRTIFTNLGTIRAEGAGGFVLADGVFDNQGTIQIDNGSKIQTSSGTVLKGTVNNTGTGQFIIVGNTKLDGVTIDGSATTTNNGTVNIDNGLTVNGTLTLGGLGNLTQLSIQGSETFDGNGDIVMEGSPVNTRITGQNFGDALTTGTGLTIRGLGNVGNNVIDIINQGTIRGTNSTLTLTLDPRTVLTNLGTIRAEGTAGLLLAAGLFDNQGTIEVDNGSKLQTSSGTVLKGTITNTGTGQVLFSANTTLDGVTVIGSAKTINNGTVSVDNGLAVNGTLTIGGLGNLTQITILGNETLTGPGEIIMEGSATATRISAFNFSDVLTLGSDLTVSGLGDIGSNVPDIVNQGTIRATSNSATLTIDPQTVFDNSGMVHAEGAAGIVLAAGNHNNIGQFMIDAGSKIDADAAGVFLTNEMTGIIGGEGTLLVNPNFVNQGTISPGMSPGTLNITGDVDNDDTATLLIEIAGSGPGQFDLLNVSGTYDVDGELVIRFLSGAESLLDTDVLTVVDANSLFQSNATLDFDSITVQGSGFFNVNYDQTNGLIQITDFRDIVPVPEPASLVLLGVAGALLVRRTSRA